METNTSAPAPNKNGAVATQSAPQQTQSERFTQMVLREFADTAGKIDITPFQRKLIQNYFIKMDMNLKDAEIKRLAKKEQYREKLAYTWQNVNMKQMAMDVVAFSSVGLDPIQKNHLNLIPFKNNKTNVYDVTFIVGYNGVELKARKYGYDVPDNVIIELVRENDKFKPFKKDKDNPVETYAFDIGDGFNRGEIVGGFYYFDYKDNPAKNKLVVMTLADIEKRKPKHAAPEFWGGTKDKWENNQKVGTETVVGWFDEMCFKTIKRAAYGSIPIDSAKVDEHLLRVMQAPEETDNVEDVVHQEIKENANKKELTMDDSNGADENEDSQQSESTDEQDQGDGSDQPEKNPI